MIFIWKLVRISLIILAVLIIAVFIASLLAAKHPHPECAYNDSVGPCEYWPLVWTDFMAGTAVVIYFAVLVDGLIIFFFTFGMGLAYLLKKLK